MVGESIRIAIYADGRSVRVRVELITETDQIEEYRVIGRDRSITLRCNRPQLLAMGLKSRRADWKLVDGIMHNASALHHIIEALDAYSKQRHSPIPPPGNAKYWSH